MKTILSYLTFFITSCLLISCSYQEKENMNGVKYHYPCNSQVSDINGMVIKSFPNDYFTDSLLYSEKDSLFYAHTDSSCYYFDNNYYSSNLYAAKEPILWNYYLDKDIYRFLWLRSFHHPVIISLIKEKNNIWLNIKKLDRNPQFMDIVYINHGRIYCNHVDSLDMDLSKADSIKKADWFANMEVDRKMKLSNTEWKQFEMLLDSCNFWNIPLCNDDLGLDGAQWVIEGHLKNKYRFVTRWSPKGNFQNCGKYLIKLSGLDEEIY